MFTSTAKMLPTPRRGELRLQELPRILPIVKASNAFISGCPKFSEKSSGWTKRQTRIVNPSPPNSVGAAEELRAVFGIGADHGAP